MTEGERGLVGLDPDARDTLAAELRILAVLGNDEPHRDVVVTRLEGGGRQQQQGHMRPGLERRRRSGEPVVRVAEEAHDHRYLGLHRRLEKDANRQLVFRPSHLDRRSAAIEGRHGEDRGLGVEAPDGR